MNVTDPVSDLLTRLRNAISARHEKADVPSARFKVELARILKDEGYIKNFKVMDDRGGSLLPGKLALAQNYPNPFNPATTISFDLPVAGKVSLKIYDILGREVATLIDGHSSAGSFRAVWDAHTGAGVPVGSGVYFYRLTAPGADGGERVLVKKMIVLK